VSKIGNAGLANVISLARTGITESQDNDRLARLMKVEAYIRTRVESGKMTPAEALSISRFLRKSQQSSDATALDNSGVMAKGSQLLENFQDHADAATIRERLEDFDTMLILNIKDQRSLAAFRNELDCLRHWGELDHAEYSLLETKLDSHTMALVVDGKITPTQAGQNFAKFMNDRSESDRIRTFLEAQATAKNASQPNLTAGELTKLDGFKPGGGNGIPV